MTVDRRDDLATAFDHSRPRLVNVAYAILSSYSDAEDVVADCWLRLVDADRKDPIRDVDAWTTVAVARAAVDLARSAYKRREHYIGPWLPEPKIEPAAYDPADRVTLDETVRYALLVALEALTPAERTAWVLHDLFGMTFGDVANTVGRTPAAVRQLASRARVHLAANSPRVDVSRAEHNRAVHRFLEAASGGDLSPLLRALDPNVVLTSDGGGLVNAALRPITGSAKVERFLLGILTNRLDADDTIRPITINGDLGVGAFNAQKITTAVSFTFEGDRIVRVDIVRSPDKLPAAED